jgi:Ca2+-binding EF-hand superfamily protein
VRFLSSVEEMVRDKMNRDGVLAESLAAGASGIDVEVMSSVKRIFKKYDADGSGAIDGNELSAMIRDLNNASASFSASAGKIPGSEFNDPAVLKDATNFVMSALSPGTKPDEEEPLLTVQAFSAWVQEGMKLTPAERKNFARQGKNRAVLVRLLRSVEEMMEILKEEASATFNGSANPEAAKALAVKETITYEGQLNRAIADVFTQYDVDGSGAIDMPELSAMITEVQVEEGVAPELIDFEESKEAARSVMKILLKGASGSGGDDDPETGCLDLPSFRDWLNKGLKMTGQQRKAFAAVKPVNAVLARFLRAVERLARQYTHDTPLSRAVRSVFVKYDVDGSGVIDVDELTSVIVDLITADGGSIDPAAAATAAAQMMKMLTSSAGSAEQNRLSEPAFLGWVHKGTKMTGAKRRAFAKQNESRRAMVLLLRTVEVRARQEVWTPEKNTLHKLFQKFDGE